MKNPNKKEFDLQQFLRIAELHVLNLLSEKEACDILGIDRRLFWNQKNKYCNVDYGFMGGCVEND